MNIELRWTPKRPSLAPWMEDPCLRHSSAAFLTGLSAATTPAKMAPVLPEVRSHLEQAWTDVENRTASMARARAELILLDNQVSYKVQFDNVPDRQKKQCLDSLHSAMTEWEHDLDDSIKFVSPNGNDSPDC